MILRQADAVTSVTSRRLSYQSSDEARQSYPCCALSNGNLRANIFLPDEHRGFYRGSRFDRSGMIASVEWNGHVFFGPWNEGNVDPLHHDNVQGTAEEFSMTDPPGFRKAAVGGTFLKIGVGMLQRSSADPYCFSSPYAIIDPGCWQSIPTDCGTAIEFEHRINDRQRGWGYCYRKRVELLADRPGFMIRRTLQNTGAQSINTFHYGHNFIGIDGQHVGPGWTLRLPYTAAVKNTSQLDNHVVFHGRDVRFSRPIPKDGNVCAQFAAPTDITSLDDSGNGFEVTVADGAGTSVTVVLRPNPEFVRIFATPRVVCPEGFVRISAQPGCTVEWSTEYRFADFDQPYLTNNGLKSTPIKPIAEVAIDKQQSPGKLSF